MLAPLHGILGRYGLTTHWLVGHTHPSSNYWKKGSHHDTIPIACTQAWFTSAS